MTAEAVIAVRGGEGAKSRLGDLFAGSDREALSRAAAPVVAVSPIVGGRALKGPAAKLMAELGAEPGVEAVAAHYRGLLAGLVIDRVDAKAIPELERRGVRALATDAVMVTDEDRTRLGRETLDFASTLASLRAASCPPRRSSRCAAARAPNRGWATSSPDPTARP